MLVEENHASTFAITEGRWQQSLNVTFQFNHYDVVGIIEEDCGFRIVLVCR